MPEKHVTNKHLLEELNELKVQFQSLQKQVQDHSTLSTRENSIQFLLAEFNELGEFWRHTDSRMESGLNLYFTASALVVSGIVYLSQQVADFRTLVTSMTIAATALFIVGAILARRILRTVFVKAEYIKALNLIRRYFIDADQSIMSYLSLPFSHSPYRATEPPGQVSQLEIPASLLMAIHAWDSLLLGFTFGSTAWLLEPRLLLGFTIGIGILVAVLCFIVLSIVQFKASCRAPLSLTQPPRFIVLSIVQFKARAMLEKKSPGLEFTPQQEKQTRAK